MDKRYRMKMQIPEHTHCSVRHPITSSKPRHRSLKIRCKLRRNLQYSGTMASVSIWPTIIQSLKACSHQASQRCVDRWYLWSFWRALWRSEWVAYPFASLRSVWRWRWRDRVTQCEQGFKMWISCITIRSFLRSRWTQNGRLRYIKEKDDGLGTSEFNV